MGRKKGSTPWNKGLTKEIDPRVGHSIESRRKLSEVLKGNKNTLGYKRSEESKRKQSETFKRNQLIKRLNTIILPESEWKICHFCGEPIKKAIGNEADSLMYHHTQYEPVEIEVPCHKGCHTGYHAAIRMKGNQYAKGHRWNQSEEAKRKIAEKNKGKKRSEGHTPWNKGLTKVSDPRIAEYAKNLSESRKGKGKGNQYAKGHRWKPNDKRRLQKRDSKGRLMKGYVEKEVKSNE